MYLCACSSDMLRYFTSTHFALFTVFTASSRPASLSFSRCNTIIRCLTTCEKWTAWTSMPFTSGFPTTITPAFSIFSETLSTCEFFMNMITPDAVLEDTTAAVSSPNSSSRGVLISIRSYSSARNSLRPFSPLCVDVT